MVALNSRGVAEREDVNRGRNNKSLSPFLSPPQSNNVLTEANIIKHKLKKRCNYNALENHEKYK
jgi:hypothetical protein